MKLNERMMLAHNAMRGWHRDAWTYRAPLSSLAMTAILGGILPLGIWYWAAKKGQEARRG